MESPPRLVIIEVENSRVVPLEEVVPVGIIVGTDGGSFVPAVDPCPLKCEQKLPVKSPFHPLSDFLFETDWFFFISHFLPLAATIGIMWEIFWEAQISLKVVTEKFCMYPMTLWESWIEMSSWGSTIGELRLHIPLR